MSPPGAGPPPPAARGLRLWVKLAALAAAGVMAMHAVHLFIGSRIAMRALVQEQEAFGRGVARLVASDAADAVLTHDAVTLNEIVARAASTGGIAYCFVVRDGEPLATSFEGGTPRALLRLRESGAAGPIVVVDGGARHLDLVEPILGGAAGAVRVGIDMRTLETTRRALAVPLGLLALAVILLGSAFALIVGRSVARPIEQLVAAADSFDPARPGECLRVHGGREMALLIDRFNRMMDRLRDAHDEQERARQKAASAERLAALGTLVAGVAHEVSNPLAALKSSVEMLEEGRGAPAGPEDLDIMRLAIGRIEGVLRRLLDVARQRPMALAPEPIQLLAADASKLAALSFRQRGIAIEETADPGALETPVLADRNLIGQALLNLLLNAGYVSKDGGRIRVRLRRRGAFRGIAIEDDGPGIPKELRQVVFDPFFSTKPAGEGTGLGLSVTRTIVDQHHGSLEFEFPERGGTTVTVWLPTAAQGRGAEVAAAVATSDGGVAKAPGRSSRSTG